MTNDEIVAQLRAWNGKSVDYLRTLRNRCGTGQEIVAFLVSLISDVDVQVAVTWLLKQTADRMCAPVAACGNDIIAQLSQITHWVAQLHILQLLHCLSFSESHRLPLERFIRDCLVSTNKLVRAWGYGALGLLADAFPQYAEERDLRYIYALEHEAASVRARIRNMQRGKRSSK